MHRVVAPSATLSKGGAFCYSVCYSPAIPFIWWGIQLWGLGRDSPDPSAFPYYGEGSSFPGLVPSDDMINSESVMGIKPGDSSVVIEVDEFTHTWSAEQFVVAPTFILGSLVRCHH